MRTIAKSLLFVGLTILLAACSLGIRNVRSQLSRLQAGMSQTEVIRIMGEPNERSFDGPLEEWAYIHNDVITVEYWVLTFDRGILQSMRQRLSNPRQEEPYPHDRHEPIYSPGYGGVYPSSDWFDRLYTEVRRTSFESDKLRLIADAARGGIFSTQQTVALMKIFTWDRERLKVLRILAPRTVLRGDAYEIINSFTFEKETARRILDEAMRTRERQGYGFGSGYPHQQNNQAWFARVLEQVRRAPFESDKLGIISDACRGGAFSASQAVSLLKVFTFDSERLKVLRIIAPNLMLRGDAYEIINTFTFEKDAARRILDEAASSYDRRYPRRGY